MSDEATVLIQALATTSVAEPWSERLLRQAAMYLRIFAIIMFIGLVTYASWFLWWTWNSGSWGTFFWQMLPITCMFFVIWRLPSSSLVEVRRNAAIRAGAQSLRELAASRDDQRAPLAGPQPSPVPASDVSAPLQIRATADHPILLVIVYGLMSVVGLMGAGCVMLSVYLVTIIVNPSAHPDLVWWEYAVSFGGVAVVGAMGAGAIWLMIYGFVHLRRDQHNQRFLADGLGLRRGVGRSQEIIAWQDVRSFFLILPRQGPTRTLHTWADQQKNPHTREIAAKLLAGSGRAGSTTYVLDAGDRIFTWSVSAHAKPASVAAYALLARVVVASTHLPLRDLTAEADAVLAASDSAALLSISPTEKALADAVPAARPRAARRLRWGCLVTLAPIIATLVFCGGGWGLQQYQHALYSGLPARIYAQHPIFADPLRAEDGYWPVHPATSDDGAYAFVDGAYQISGGNGQAMLDQNYGNVAVAVTVRERPTNYNTETMGSLGQIGLIVRATDHPAGLLTFTIGPLGDWSLMRYREWGPDSGQWQFLAGGTHDPAIHWGFGDNRLLIVMRGSQYICFINDRLVAVTSDGALSSGQAGLWLDNNTVIGRYTNFAVYPAV